jgi:hypothetical protein
VARPVTSSIYIPPSKPGDAVWVRSADAARFLIENGICEWPKKAAPPVAAEASTAAQPPSRRLPLRNADGWPIDRFALIERAWEGETLAIVCSGPSLTAADLERVRGRMPVIAVNDNYLVAPFADIVYFADAQWWKWHSTGIEKNWAWARFTSEQVKKAFAEFRGQKCTIENTGLQVSDPGVFFLHNFGSEGLSDRPNGLHTGSNSGYQAINLAVLAGAKRILLLGYDMKHTGGRSHAHNGHPVKHPEDVYLRYARNFATMVPHLQKLGVEVVNCTPQSAITCFPKEALESVLAAA